jgi:hypothetical protein
MSAMDLDTCRSLCSHLCGQKHCLVVGGTVLPLCQRCLGLYSAMLITGTALLGSGAWRRGYPPGGKVILHAALLLAAMAGGLHWIDAGPAWRVLCGFWTGHVAAAWLLGGGAVLFGLSRPGPRPAWQEVAGWAAPAVYAAVALCLTV